NVRRAVSVVGGFMCAPFLESTAWRVEVGNYRWLGWRLTVMRQTNQEIGNLCILRRQTWLVAITGDADTEGTTRQFDVDPT
ncbi:hypothetical protein, partial [Pseudomonas sp. PA-3-11C]|uniref:hypothetical protein n=1 Tax=Pseudomonas sp. PA-3-11C TaxID=2665472 RepID=UPI001F2750D6